MIRAFGAATVALFTSGLALFAAGDASAQCQDGGCRGAFVSATPGYVLRGPANVYGGGYAPPAYPPAAGAYGWPPGAQASYGCAIACVPAYQAEEIHVSGEFNGGAGVTAFEGGGGGGGSSSMGFPGMSQVTGFVSNMQGAWASAASASSASVNVNVTATSTSTSTSSSQSGGGGHGGHGGWGGGSGGGGGYGGGGGQSGSGQGGGWMSGGGHSGKSAWGGRRRG